jgi:hypothetical protein
MLGGTATGTAVTTSCDVVEARQSKEVARMNVSLAALGALLCVAQVMPPQVDAVHDDDRRYCQMLCMA